MMKRQTYARIEDMTHIEALKLALDGAEHLDKLDAPHIREAFDIAEALDGLLDGRDPHTRRREIVKLGERYNAILKTLELGRYRAMPSGEARQEMPEHEPVRPQSALERMMFAVVNE